MQQKQQKNIRSQDLFKKHEIETTLSGDRDRDHQHTFETETRLRPQKIGLATFITDLWCAMVDLQSPLFICKHYLNNRKCYLE